jgi:DNA-binding IclR family transcriptional regulator
MSFIGRAAAMPAHATALGRAILAFAPRPVVEAVITAGLRTYTAHTITSPERFRHAIAVTQLTKVAITRGEWEPDVCGVAMPVFGSGGEVVAAIELTFDHLTDEMNLLLAALRIGTRSLSRELAGMTRRPVPDRDEVRADDITLVAAGVGPDRPTAD